MMSVGSGLNPVLDCVDIFFLGLLGWECLRIVYVVIVNAPTCCVMLLGVFPPGGLSTLLYYLVLIVYTCLMPPVLYSRVWISLYSSLRLDPFPSGLRHYLGSNESVE